MIDIFITVYVLIAMYFFYDLASSEDKRSASNLAMDAVAALLWLPFYVYQFGRLILKTR